MPDAKVRAFGGDGSNALRLAEEAAAKSHSLKWYVDLYSPWPVLLQYVYLWCKRTVFRRSLDE